MTHLVSYPAHACYDGEEKNQRDQIPDCTHTVWLRCGVV